MQKFPIQHIHPGTDKTPDELDRNENYRIVKIGENWFSYTAKGESIYFHLFSESPKTLSNSCELFINWLFSEYEWCKMLIVTTNRNSLTRLAIKHKFNIVERAGNSVFLMRAK